MLCHCLKIKVNQTLGDISTGDKVFHFCSLTAKFPHIQVCFLFFFSNGNFCCSPLLSVPQAIVIFSILV